MWESTPPACVTPPVCDTLCHLLASSLPAGAGREGSCGGTSGRGAPHGAVGTWEAGVSLTWGREQPLAWGGAGPVGNVRGGQQGLRGELGSRSQLAQTDQVGIRRDL